MDDTVEVRVTFEFAGGPDGNPPDYRDALYFTEDEYAALTPGQLHEAKQKRYQDWLKIINTPTPSPDPTPTPPVSDVGQQLQDIAQQATALAQQAMDAAAALPQEVSNGAQAEEEPAKVRRKAKRF